jgi:hypothetical protein
LGQTIKVFARLGDGGSMSVREIENRLDSEYTEAGNSLLKLQGAFLGVDSQGNWEINGVKFAVDRSTRLEGSPTLRRTIAVEAIRQEDGSLLARSISGETPVGRLSGNRAELTGVIEEVLDNGSLVIQGLSIARGILTESEGDIQTGDFVEVEILIQMGGSLLAMGVESKDQSALRDYPGSNPVDMQGILDRVNPNGTLIVNGISISVGPLSQVKGSLISGAGVSVKGLFAPDGSIVARELKIRGRRAALGGVQATIQGWLEEVKRNRSGEASAIVINGVAINLETLTQVNSGLDTGTPVLARAFIVDGEFVAREIEDLDTSTDPPKRGRFVINGSIDDIELDDQGQPEILKLNGRDFVVSSMAITGEAPVEGSAVEIQGDIDDGVLLATNIESERESTENQGRIEFDVQGAITSIINDENGNVAGFAVDGNRLSLRTLTLFDGILERGMFVQVAGIVSEGQLLAIRIKQIEEST